jgi:hypothetical protein
MPDENFFPKYTRGEQATEAELEQTVVAKSLGNEKYLLRQIQDGKYGKFIVTPDKELVITEGSHNYMAEALGVKLHECLIEDGYIKYDINTGVLSLGYSKAVIARVPHIRTVALKKISEFFQSKGINITRAKEEYLPNIYREEP